MAPTRSRDDRRFEQPLGRRDLQIVGEVEDVHDQRARRAAFVCSLDVEVAEGHRVRVNAGLASARRRDRKEHPGEPLHGVQW